MAQITNKGIPNRQTKGALGDIYTDTNTGKKYKCTGAYIYNTVSESKAEYDWKPIIDINGITKSKSTPSNIGKQDKKVDKVVKPAFVEPDILPVSEEVVEKETPKPERRDSKTAGKHKGNYNKYYQQKKVNEK